MDADYAAKLVAATERIADALERLLAIAEEEHNEEG